MDWPPQPVHGKKGLVFVVVLPLVLAGSTRLGEVRGEEGSCAAWPERGKELLGRRKFREAQEMLVAATGACPKTAPLFDTLGLAYDFGNQFDAAQGAYQKAVDLSPQDTRFRNHLAASLLRSGNAIRGRDEFEKVLEIDPRNTFANLNLGSFYLNQKQYKKAIRHFQAAHVERSLDPLSLLELTEAYFGAGDAIAARQLAVRLSRLAGLDDTIHFSLGLQLAEHGEYQMAAEQFAAIPPSRRDTATYLNLGMAYSRLRRFEEARQANEDAIRLDPSNPEPYLRMGLDAAAHGHHNDALDWITQAYNKAPERADIVFAFAEELIDNGNFERAEVVLSSARQRQPADPAIWEALGDLYFRQHRNPQAQQAYRQCLRLSPDRIQTRVSLALTDLNLGRSEGAQKELEHVLRLDPQNPEANAQLGRIALLAGRKEAALQYASRALVADLENLTANEDYARLKLQQDKPAEALPALERLVRNSPDSPRFHYLLGQALQRLERQQEAQNEFALSKKLQAAEKETSTPAPAERMNP